MLSYSTSCVADATCRAPVGFMTQAVSRATVLRYSLASATDSVLAFAWLESLHSILFYDDSKDVMSYKPGCDRQCRVRYSLPFYRSRSRIFEPA